MSSIVEPSALRSFGPEFNAAVIGASGGLGGALLDAIAQAPGCNHLVALSRTPLAFDHPPIDWLAIDLESETSIAAAAQKAQERAERLHLVIVASGILHDGPDMQPEKSWRAISGPAMERAFRLNAIGPALLAKHFLPLLDQDRKAAFAALSARVGSIEDNALGGWHAYRASKSALNMIIKTLSIELARRNPTALCVGLHPGTVDSRLSKPFQSSLSKAQLFSPAQSAQHLLRVLDDLRPEDSGHVFAWDGARIAA